MQELRRITMSVKQHELIEEYLEHLEDVQDPRAEHFQGSPIFNMVEIITFDGSRRTVQEI